MGQIFDGRQWLSILACAFFALPASAQDTDDSSDDKVTRTPCDLGAPLGEGTVVVVAGPTSYGTHTDSHEQTSTLYGAGDRQMLSFKQTVTDDSAEITLSCADGRALLTSGNEQVPFLISLKKTQLDPRFRASVAQAWQKPARSPETRTQRETWSSVVGLALDVNLPGSADAIAGLDYEVADSLALLVARDDIELADFESADGRLAYLADRARATKPGPVPRSFPSTPPLSAANAARWAALGNQLSAARKRSAPVQLGPRRRLTEAPALLSSPLDFYAAPTLFWRGSELCVAAPDTAPSAPSPSGTPAPAPAHMRCYAPATGHPGPEEAFVPPLSSANHLVYRDFTSSRNTCSLGAAVWKNTPKSDAPPCNGGPGVGTDEMLAVVDGDAIFARDVDQLHLVRGVGRVETIDAARARDVVRRSAGTQLFLKGMSYFVPSRVANGPFDKRILRLAGREGQTWDVFGAPPQGVFWVGTPLVSPDQRWVTVQSGRPSGPVSVWLFPVQ